MDSDSPQATTAEEEECSCIPVVREVGMSRRGIAPASTADPGEINRTSISP